jgi:hypothetical protein
VRQRRGDHDLQTGVSSEACGCSAPRGPLVPIPRPPFL